jgi:hypothetical protein
MKYKSYFPGWSEYFHEHIEKVGVTGMIGEYEYLIEGFESNNSGPESDYSKEFMRFHSIPEEYLNDISCRTAIEILYNSAEALTDEEYKKVVELDRRLMDLLLLNPDNLNIKEEQIKSTKLWWKEYLPIGLDPIL